MANEQIIGTDHIKPGSYFTHEDRYLMVKLIESVCYKNEQSTDVLFLSVNLADRFLASLTSRKVEEIPLKEHIATATIDIAMKTVRTGH
jgi:hypothetical protein